MKINVIKVSIASAVAFSVLWIICSLMVWMMPEYMLRITASMMHISPNALNWDFSWSGVMVGCVAWAVTSGVTVAVTAAIYNMLVPE